MRFQRAYLIGFALHFFLLVTVASRDFFAVLADGSSYLPAALEPRWRVLEDATLRFLAKSCRLIIRCARPSPFICMLRESRLAMATSLPTFPIVTNWYSN